MQSEAWKFTADKISSSAPLVLCYYWHWHRAFIFMQVRTGEKAKSVTTPGWNDAKKYWHFMRGKGTNTTYTNQLTPLFAIRSNPAELNCSHLWTLYILPSVQYSIFWGEVRDANGVQASVLEKGGALEYLAHGTFKGAQQVQSRHCTNQLF